MMIVKATSGSEAGVMASAELIGKIAKYDEEPARAGRLADASGV
jgi:hypothetical protein